MILHTRKKNPFGLIKVEIKDESQLMPITAINIERSEKPHAGPRLSVSPGNWRRFWSRNEFTTNIHGSARLPKGIYDMEGRITERREISLSTEEERNGAVLFGSLKSKFSERFSPSLFWY